MPQRSQQQRTIFTLTVRIRKLISTLRDSMMQKFLTLCLILVGELRRRARGTHYIAKFAQSCDIVGHGMRAGMGFSTRYVLKHHLPKI